MVPSFSHEGPSEEEMAQTSLNLRFVGKGYTNAAEAATGGKPDYKVR
jgi:hypothetical protein